jgi:hypothetical protein
MSETGERLGAIPGDPVAGAVSITLRSRRHFVAYA